MQYFEEGQFHEESVKFPGPLSFYPVLLPAWITSSIILDPYTQKYLHFWKLWFASGIMLHEANFRQNVFHNLLRLSIDFHFFNGTISFLINIPLKRMPLLLTIEKFFFFTMSRLRHISMGSLAYVVKKTVFSLMNDWNVVNNSKFFILFCTSSHIFGVKNTSKHSIFSQT